MTTGNPFEDFELIHAYTRAQAIEDGVLVELPAALAKEAGFRVPACLTRAAWEAVAEVPEAVAGVQSTTGRLWDLLTILRISAAGKKDDRVSFEVLTRDEEPPAPLRRHRLLAVIGPGDDPSPVLTIGYPEDF